EDLVAINVDLGKLIGLGRVLDGERVEVVDLLERRQLLRRGIGDTDPDEFVLVLRARNALVDRDFADALSVPVKIGGDNGHTAPRRLRRRDYQKPHSAGIPFRRKGWHCARTDAGGRSSDGRDGSEAGLWRGREGTAQEAARRAAQAARGR